MRSDDGQNDRGHDGDGDGDATGQTELLKSSTYGTFPNARVERSIIVLEAAATRDVKSDGDYWVLSASAEYFTRSG